MTMLCPVQEKILHTDWLRGWKGSSSPSASILSEEHTKASFLLLLPVVKPREQIEDWGEGGTTGSFLLPCPTLALALTSLSLTSRHVKGLCLSKVRQRNPETRAVGCCLNYSFGLCYLGLMTLLVKNTIKWLIGRCAAGAQAMLISHFILFINMVQNWGKSQPTLKCLCFLLWVLHFQPFIHLHWGNSLAYFFMFLHSFPGSSGIHCLA